MTSLHPAQQRLIREITLLQKCEREFGLPAKPVIDQLVADSDRPLPDILPQRLQWVRFEWPESRSVDYTAYWKQVDRNESKWMGPYL